MEVLKRAHAHRGASLVEIFQNCVVFNDNVFGAFTERSVVEDAQIHVEHGQPLLFGKERNRGLRFRPGKIALEVVTVGEDGITEGDIIVHDQANRALASMLIALEPPYPVAVGVIYDDPTPTYESAMFAEAPGSAQVDLEAVDRLLRGGRTWEVIG